MEYYNNELYHFGIKGMKWGVRRYQNKDGSLTPAGQKRYVMDEYKKLGASKTLSRNAGSTTYQEAKLMNKTDKTIGRLSTNNNGSKYTNRQRAKDYDTAIRGLNQLKSDEMTRSYYDMDQISSNQKRIEKLQNKKPSERINKKIQKLTTDNQLMGIGISQAADRYKRYEGVANNLIDKMSKDKAVVYTTRYDIHSRTGGDVGYMMGGTDYKVRANTKRRSNSKKYNDPKRKKQYDTEFSKYRTEYYYY